MKSYQGFESKKSAQVREILPAGNYVAKILQATEQKTADGKLYILLNFDIAEGEFANFFRMDYDGQEYSAFIQPKWRGTYRLWEPLGDGSQQDGWTIKTFNNAIACVEESNFNYHWDWNENFLKNKLIGVCYRNKEWAFGGRSGWTTECGALASVQDVRDGKIKILKDKALPQGAKPVQSQYSFTQINDEELPF